MNPKNRILNGRSATRVGTVWALCACLASPVLAQEGGGGQNVEVSEFGTVTLAVQETDLAQVLELLAIQSQKNIITSKNVSATISANLYDVTFYEALDAILRVNGYRYIEDGNFIYIYTQQEFDEINAAKRKTTSRIYKLNNLSATDANELIAPLLSEQGRSSFRGDVDSGIEPDTSDVGADGWAFSPMLVVNDFEENLDQISSFISGMDSAPPQVLVESTIIQTTLDESNAFGVDFSIIGSLDFTNLTSPLGAVNNLIGGDDENGFQPPDNRATAISSTIGNTSGAGGFKVGVLRDDFGVFLRLLDEVTDSTVLARPKIMCLNRQRAEVLVGARVGYLSTTATETTTTQTVEFLDTGIHLMFRPFIGDNGMIRLELAPSVSEASLRTVTDAQGITVTIPDELTREVTTNVRVRNEETLVLGGLYRESVRNTRRQVPVLGDIPIVGGVFRGQDDVVDRDEIIFLITPRIVDDEALWAVGEHAEGYADEVQVGAREGLLWFSRTKQTENYNQRAARAFAQGDVDYALHYTNMSLRLASNQPEMVQFRERLVGMKETPHERSILQQTFHPELIDYGPSSSAGVVIDRTFEAPSRFRSLIENANQMAVGQDAMPAEAQETWTYLPPVTTERVAEEPASPDHAENESESTTDDAEGEAVTTVTEDEPVSSADQTESTDAPVTAAGTGEAYAAWNRARNTSSDEFVPFTPADPATVASRRNVPPVAADTGEFVPFERTGSVAATPSTPEMRVSTSPETPMNQEGADEFVDRFIHEYFNSLGYGHLSPYADDQFSEASGDAYPFTSFDEAAEDLVGTADGSPRPE